MLIVTNNSVHFLNYFLGFFNTQLLKMQVSECIRRKNKTKKL